MVDSTKAKPKDHIVRLPGPLWRYVRRRMRARETVGDTLRRLLQRDGKAGAK